LDSKSSIGCRSLSRSSLLTQERENLGFSVKLEELIMTIMLLRVRLRPEKRLKEMRSQLILKPRELESTR